MLSSTASTVSNSDSILNIDLGNKSSQAKNVFLRLDTSTTSQTSAQLGATQAQLDFRNLFKDEASNIIFLCTPLLSV